MILVDTSVWIDHFREGSTELATLLESGQVLCHPWVIGELALGRLDFAGEELTLIAKLPSATVATSAEMLQLIGIAQLGGPGIGYVDAQLIASARLSWGARVWTRDRRLSVVCDKLGIAHKPVTTQKPKHRRVLLQAAP